jgi:hypothetical protein
MTSKSARRLGRCAGIAAAVAMTMGAPGLVTGAAAADSPAAPTFTRDIAPILQRSCQNCHRPDGVAPMSLVTYEEVRPYARAIKQRTSIGPHRGVMPPWYIEKNVGIQKYKDDPSLSDAEMRRSAGGLIPGPQDNQPTCRPRENSTTNTWLIGPPDLIVKTQEPVVANAPDWWGGSRRSISARPKTATSPHCRCARSTTCRARTPPAGRPSAGVSCFTT